MVRIEISERLYIIIGNTYKIRTSFESALGLHTNNYVGIVCGIIDQDLILARGTVAYSYLTCWGGSVAGINSILNQKIPLTTIESIVKIK